MKCPFDKFVVHVHGSSLNEFIVRVSHLRLAVEASKEPDAANTFLGELSNAQIALERALFIEQAIEREMTRADVVGSLTREEVPTAFKRDKKTGE